METLKHFINWYDLTMDDPDWAPDNPNMDDSEFTSQATHWVCTLHREDRTMAVPFSQGSAHIGPPSIEDVLDCLASDASGVENSGHDFEKWCDEYGYDTDSRRAERTFNACQTSANELAALLGSRSIFEALLWETERQ